MKPLPLAFAILGGVALVGGAIGIKNLLQLKRDGDAITKLIAEYKAMGIPTNGGELVKKVPNSENAWIEIGPILEEVTPNGAKIFFKSALPLELLMTCGKQDLPLLDEYLSNNRAKRDAIDVALKAKPKLQVPHDYDQGYMMLLPEFAAMRPLVREFCLAAYVAGLRGDYDGVERNLTIANRFAASCIARPEYIASVSGAAYRKLIYMTAFRIRESNPIFGPRLQSLVLSPPFQTSADPFQIFRSEFIADLSIARSYDSPAMDRPSLPSFMKGIAKVQDESTINASTKVHHGDYVPQSQTMRTFLRNRLETWKPFFESLKSKRLPTASEFMSVSELTSTLPSKLAFLMPQGMNDDNMIYRGIGLAKQYADMDQAMWSAIVTKERTGRYPHSLSDIGISVNQMVPEDIIEYEATNDHLLIRSSHRSTFDTTQPSLAYPPLAGISATTLSEYRSQVARYRKGEILYTGSDAKSTTRRPISVPPGAPKPVP